MGLESELGKDLEMSEEEAFRVCRETGGDVFKLAREMRRLPSGAGVLIINDNYVGPIDSHGPKPWAV